MGPVEESIRDILQAEFSPSYMDVVNESYMHAVPKGSESHFKLVLVTDQFNKQRAVQRHQAVYKALAGPLQHTVHALALHTYTPVEWEREGEPPRSPNCLGGH
jgi:BolA protein